MGMKSKKKLLIAVVLLVLIGLGLSITWQIGDWPPPRLILKYGLPPAGGATGRSWVSKGGAVYFEIRAGYCKAPSPVRRTLGERVRALLSHLPWADREPLRADPLAGCWVEVEYDYWISLETSIPATPMVARTALAEEATLGFINGAPGTSKRYWAYLRLRGSQQTVRCLFGSGWTSVRRWPNELVSELHDGIEEEGAEIERLLAEMEAESTDRAQEPLISSGPTPQAFSQHPRIQAPLVLTEHPADPLLQR